MTVATSGGALQAVDPRKTGLSPRPAHNSTSLATPDGKLPPNPCITCGKMHWHADCPERRRVKLEKARARKEKERKKGEKDRRGAALSGDVKEMQTDSGSSKGTSGAAAVGIASEVLVSEDFFEGGGQTVSLSKGAGLVTLTSLRAGQVSAANDSSSSSLSSDDDEDSTSGSSSDSDDSSDSSHTQDKPSSPRTIPKPSHSPTPLANHHLYNPPSPSPYTWGHAEPPSVKPSPTDDSETRGKIRRERRKARVTRQGHRHVDPGWPSRETITMYLMGLNLALLAIIVAYGVKATSEQGAWITSSLHRNTPPLAWWAIARGRAKLPLHELRRATSITSVRAARNTVPKSTRVASHLQANRRRGRLLHPSARRPRRDHPACDPLWFDARPRVGNARRLRRQARRMHHDDERFGASAPRFDPPNACTGAMATSALHAALVLFARLLLPYYRMAHAALGSLRKATRLCCSMLKYFVTLLVSYSPPPLI